MKSEIKELQLMTKITRIGKDYYNDYTNKLDDLEKWVSSRNILPSKTEL